MVTKNDKLRPYDEEGHIRRRKWI